MTAIARARAELSAAPPASAALRNLVRTEAKLLIREGRPAAVGRGVPDDAAHRRRHRVLRP